MAPHLPSRRPSSPVLFTSRNSGGLHRCPPPVGQPRFSPRAATAEVTSLSPLFIVRRHECSSVTTVGGFLLPRFGKVVVATLKVLLLRFQSQPLFSCRRGFGLDGGRRLGIRYYKLTMDWFQIDKR